MGDDENIVGDVYNICNYISKKLSLRGRKVLIIRLKNMDTNFYRCPAEFMQITIGIHDSYMPPANWF